MNRDYTIIESKYPALVAKIAQINKKAAKWGLPLVAVQAGDVYTQSCLVDGQQVIWDVRDVTIAGETPQINGWLVVAHIEHTTQYTKIAQEAKLEISRIERNGGTAWGGLVHDSKQTERINLVRTFAGAWDLELTLPAEYRNCAPQCDHCKTTRPRRYSFVLWQESQGFKLVGTACVGNYTGALDPHWFARAAEMMNSLQDSLDSAAFAFGMGGGRTAFDTANYLGYVFAEIQINGWVSRAAAEETYTVASADNAWATFTGRQSEAQQILLSPMPEHRAKAQAAIAWLTGKIEAVGSNPSQFELSLYAYARLTYMEHKHAGFVAAIANAYNRHLDAEAAKKALPNTGASKHVGQIKERLEFSLTLIGESSTQGQFGLTMIYKFADAAGNVFTWFASNDQDLERGQTYTIKATVKGHTQYNGVNETQITRGTITRPAPAE